jgi:hypothetical protein
VLYPRKLGAQGKQSNLQKYEGALPSLTQVILARLVKLFPALPGDIGREKGGGMTNVTKEIKETLGDTIAKRNWAN